MKKVILFFGLLFLNSLNGMDSFVDINTNNKKENFGLLNFINSKVNPNIQKYKDYKISKLGYEDADPKLKELVEECCKSLEITEPIRIKKVPQEYYGIGGMAYSLYGLLAIQHDFDDPRLMYTIFHELSHIKNKDSHKNELLQVAEMAGFYFIGDAFPSTRIGKQIINLLETKNLKVIATLLKSKFVCGTLLGYMAPDLLFLFNNIYRRKNEKRADLDACENLYKNGNARDIIPTIIEYSLMQNTIDTGADNKLKFLAIINTHPLPGIRKEYMLDFLIDKGFTEIHCKAESSVNEDQTQVQGNYKFKDPNGKLVQDSFTFTEKITDKSNTDKLKN